jgi:hypothetical protein
LPPAVLVEILLRVFEPAAPLSEAVRAGEGGAGVNVVSMTQDTLQTAAGE